MDQMTIFLSPSDNVVGLSLQSGSAQDTWCLNASSSPNCGEQREKCGFSHHRIVDKIIIIIIIMIIIEIKEENCRPPIFIQRTTHFHGQIKRPGWNSQIEYPRNLQCDWLERGGRVNSNAPLPQFPLICIISACGWVNIMTENITTKFFG